MGAVHDQLGLLLGFIGKAASGNLTDLLGAVQTLTAACPEQSGGFVVDNSAANGLIKGCVQKVAKGAATIGVTNLRLISFALSGGALDTADGTILDPGDTITFTAGGPKLAQPLVAEASLSALALGHQLTDMLLRLLPGSDVFTKAGSYGKVLKAVATAEAKVWTSAKVLDKLQKHDVPGAAEEAFSAMTDHSFLGAFASAAALAGQSYGIPYLSAVTPARLAQAELAANLLVLDTTVLSWDVQFFIAAYGELKVTWPTPPGAPTNVTMLVDLTSCPVGGSLPCAIYIRWHDASSSESGYRIYVRECVSNAPPGQFWLCTPSDFSSRYTLVKTLPPNSTAFEAFDGDGSHLPPEGRYYVAAFDTAGESSRILAGDVLFGY